MAKFFTDFSEYTADQQPPDWTERWNTGDGAANVRNSGIPGTPSQGGSHALEITRSAGSNYAISWDEVGTPSGDVQVLVLAYFEHTADVPDTLWTILHGAGAADSEDAYFSDIRLTATNEVALLKLASGSYTTFGASDEGLVRNQWIWVRLDRSSSTIRVRAWADGNSEPDTWAVSTTDSAYSSGWVGLGSLSSGGSSWFAQVGVGTGGDEAPAEEPPAIAIDSVTPSEFADGDTGVTIAGSGYGASQGTGKVELGDNSDYATATLVTQTVTSWSDTSIDFTVVQGALSPGTVYAFVTNDAGDTTAGFAVTLQKSASGTAAIAVIADPSATGTKQASGSAALATVAATNATGSKQGDGAASLAVIAATAATGSKQTSGAAQLAVIAATSGAGGKQTSGAAALAVIAATAASGSGSEAVAGAAAITVIAALATSGAKHETGAAAIVVTVSLSALGSSPGEALLYRGQQGQGLDHPQGRGLPTGKATI